MDTKDTGSEMEPMGENGSVGNTFKPRRKRCRTIMENLMIILTMIGICLGFALGLSVREFNPSDDVILWIGLPGNLYMRLLKMSVMPVVVCSVITGVSSLDPKTNGKIGACVIICVAVTHVIAASMATGLVLLIKPGAQRQDAVVHKVDKAMKTQDVFADLLRNLMPDNIMEATFRQTVTKYIQKQATVGLDNRDLNQTMTSNASVPTAFLNDAGDFTRVISHTDGVNVLGLITISVIFGIAAGKVKHRVSSFLLLIENLMELSLIMVKWIVWLTPIGVTSLIAHSIAEVDNIYGTFADIGLFALTVIVGLTIHWVVILPSLYAIIVRRKPWRFFLSHFPVVSIGFASANTAACMPEMFPICDEKFHMDKRLCRLAIPLTVTMNTDGSSIFIISACMFITDYTGLPITPEHVLVVLLLTIVSCMAIPPVPSASIVTIIIILTAVRVPLHNVALLFAVEWLLDRIRTCVNAVSDMTIVAMANTLCRKDLQLSDNNYQNHTETI